MYGYIPPMLMRKNKVQRRKYRAYKYTKLLMFMSAYLRFQTNELYICKINLLSFDNFSTMPCNTQYIGHAFPFLQLKHGL